MKSKINNVLLIIGLGLLIPGLLITESVNAQLLAQPTLTLTAASDRIYVGQNSTTNLSGGAGMGAISYQSNTPATCSVSTTGTITGIKPGECLITVNKLGDITYDPAKATAKVIIDPLKGTVQLKMYKTYFSISVKMPAELYYSDGPAVKGTYYRVLVGNQIIKSQKIR